MLKDYEELLTEIKKIDESNYKSTFLIGLDIYPIKKILIQTLVRIVDNEEIHFIGIRDIEIDEKEKSKGTFKHIISIFENKNVPFIVDDIINYKLDSYLEQKGYLKLTYTKYENEIISRYILKKMI